MNSRVIVGTIPSPKTYNELTKALETCGTVVGLHVSYNMFMATFAEPVSAEHVKKCVGREYYASFGKTLEQEVSETRIETIHDELERFGKIVSVQTDTVATRFKYGDTRDAKDAARTYGLYRVDDVVSVLLDGKLSENFDETINKYFASAAASPPEEDTL